MTAYNELYIEDSMNIMGEMFDFAVNYLNFDIDTFYSCFVSSYISKNFEVGNPKFIAGVSGDDLAIKVLKSIGIDSEYVPPVAKNNYESTEYTIGRIIAYFQWNKNVTFKEISDNGLAPSEIIKNYDLSNYNLTMFIIKIDRIFNENYFSKETKLAYYRKLRGLTQKQLSEKSGVSLRMVQLYEQRKNDISKASVEVVLSLSDALMCEVKDLIR